MNLVYKGVNKRGRSEWVDLDLTSKLNPEGAVMEDWQMIEYKRFVETAESCVGRELTKSEASTVLWLCGSEGSSIDNILGLIKSAYEAGK